jgi:hypothetical protein
MLSVLKDERPTSNVQRPTSNVDAASFFDFYLPFFDVRCSMSKVRRSDFPRSTLDVECSAVDVQFFPSRLAKYFMMGPFSKFMVPGSKFPVQG